jgi:single-stranded DNA-binding protein
MMNVVVLQGTLSRPPVDRTLSSGTRLTAFEVTTRPPDGRAVSVPVVWFDAPIDVGSFDVGTDVVVVGEVRRRFFGTIAGTQSRTEVVASIVAKRSQRKRLERWIDAVVDEVGALTEPASSGG